MASLFALSVYEINGNPGSVPQGPKAYLFSPGTILRVTPYVGQQIYRCYALVYTSEGFNWGVLESESTIATRANA